MNAHLAGQSFHANRRTVHLFLVDVIAATCLQGGGYIATRQAFAVWLWIASA
jgi:hypothetical protein